MKRIISFLFIIAIALPLHAVRDRDMIVLVHPFSNTGDNRYEWLSAGMADSVISDLMMVKNVRVISEKDRRKTVKEIEFSMSGMVDEQAAVKAGSMVGANVIFTGSFAVINNNVRVVAKLIDVKSGELVKTAKLDGTLDKIFQLQDRIVITLLAEAQKIELKDVRPVVITEEDKNAIHNKPEVSFSAYELYSKGLQIRYNNPSKALEYYKKAIEYDPNYGDALEQAGYISGSVFNRFDESIDFLNRAERVFRNHPGEQSEKYANVIIDIGTIYWSKGELDRARDYYNKARNIFDSLGMRNSFGYASASWGLGLIYYGKRQTAESLRYYNESQSIYEILGLQNTTSFADLMTNFGSLYHTMYRHDDALSYYFKSRSILDSLQLQNTTAYANALWGIGLIYYEKQNYDEALRYYTSAERTMVNLRMQDTAAYANLIMNVGIVHERLNRLDDAMRYYNRCKNIFETLNLQNTLNFGNLLMNMGLVFQRQNNNRQALQYFFSSKSLLERLQVQNSQSYANALYNIAYTYDVQGQREQAVQYYRSAADIYRNINIRDWEQRARNRIQELGY
ncbi:MAG TPA: tetratricopeptide repeat protein [Spirochaetota bacterium]|nr:tetratricopeptide repeat protein [Spirochaetota bacterium]